MAKSSTYLLRLDPQKKARRMLLAKEMGLDLAKWYEAAAEAFEGNRPGEWVVDTKQVSDYRPPVITDLQTPATGLIGEPRAKTPGARGREKAYKTDDPKSPYFKHKGFQNGPYWVCDEDCKCRCK